MVLAVDGVTSEEAPVRVWFGRNAAGKLLLAFDPAGTYDVKHAAYTQKESAASALTEDQQRELDKVGNSIDWNSIDGARTAGDNVFELANNDGEEKTLDLPGISIFNDAALQGWATRYGDCLQDGQRVQRRGGGAEGDRHHSDAAGGSTNYRTSQATTAEITMPVGPGPSRRGATREASRHVGWSWCAVRPFLPPTRGCYSSTQAWTASWIPVRREVGSGTASMHALSVCAAGTMRKIMDKIAYGPRNINPPASPASTGLLRRYPHPRHGLGDGGNCRRGRCLHPRSTGGVAGHSTCHRLSCWLADHVLRAVGRRRRGTGGLDEAAVDLRVDHGIDAQVEDFAKTATADVMQRTQLATLMNGATADAQRISYDNLKDTPDPAAPQRASGIIPIAAVPSIVGFAVGTIEDVGGVLYELVDDDDEGNVLRGENAASEGGYRASRRLRDKPSPATGRTQRCRQPSSGAKREPPSRLRAQLPKMALGGSPPGSLGFRVVDDRGETTNIVVMRQAARDTAGADGVYGYASSLDGPVIDTPDGHSFTATVFDETFTTPVKVHSEDRWELYENRQAGGLSKAAIENLISKIGIEPIYDHVKSILRAGRRTPHHPDGREPSPHHRGTACSGRDGFPSESADRGSLRPAAPRHVHQ